MSYIEKYRVGDKICEREMWETSDIADYCHLEDEMADHLHILANKAWGIIGYGDIEKWKFMMFINQIEKSADSQRLQDEANAASILYAQKNFSFSQFSFWVSQAISFLKNL